MHKFANILLFPHQTQIRKTNTILKFLLFFRSTLKALNLGLKGELTITPAMEALGNSLFLDSVPEPWEKKAYPSMAGFTEW